MSVDDVMRLVIRNFVTLFLLVACVTVPLHLGKAFIFRKVEAVREIHADIESFPPDRVVRGVGAAALDDAQQAALVVTGIEILLVPLLVAGTRRALERDAMGRLPSVADAWAHAWRLRVSIRLPAALLTGLVAAIATGLLAHRIGFLIAEPLGPTVMFAGVGLSEGVARALAAPFLLVPLALPLASAQGKDPAAPTN